MERYQPPGDRRRLLSAALLETLGRR